jgi:signal transduction histidine kinase
MGVLRSLLWALVTGRDRDLGPPLKWWRGPAWAGWVLACAVMAAWGTTTFVVWTLTANGYYAALLVLLQVSAPLLGGRRPLTAFRITLVATVAALVVVRPIPYSVGLVHSWPLDAYLIPFVPVLVTAVARSQGKNAVGLAMAPLLLLVGGSIWVGERFGLSVMTGPIISAVFAVVIGFVLGDSRRTKRESDEEREQRIVLLERQRIARELHDVIGHHLSMIAVRTDSAPYRLSGLSDSARDEFAELGAAARQALDEARSLIGVLRDDNSEVEHVPQPTIDEIPLLVEQSRTSGATVRLTATGSTSGVPAMVGLAAYRIVQESLSNALRHSPGAPVEIQMTAAPSEIELSVSNGPGSHRPSSGDGTGLAGIRERVALVGGSCTAGPSPDGGFRVWARLPR